MKAKLLGLMSTLLLAGPGSAWSATVFFGTDVSGSTTNSDSAYVNWRAGVSGEVSDNLDGLAGTGGANANLTSTVGNNFTTSGEVLSAQSTGTIGVLSGAHLEFTSANNGGLFTWNLKSPASAFGFFAFDLDGADILVSFTDGSSQQYSATTASGGSENSFWGIRGLNSLIASVTIGSSTGQTSYWDRFVHGTTSVPEPGTLALLGLGLAGLGMARRRKARCHEGSIRGLRARSSWTRWAH